MNFRRAAWATTACLILAAGAAAQKRPPAKPQPAAAAAPSAPEWPQWGGPNRNFKPPADGLADSWPEAGPRQLWSRVLGEGHSSILVDRGRLYTMYSSGDREAVIAVDAATGKTVWEHVYDAPRKGLELEYGNGPHSTPLIVGNLIFAVGVTGKMYALDKQSGSVVWSHDLWGEFKGKRDGRGYACSPIAYKSTVIVTVGGAGQYLMAFNQQNGGVAWKNQNFDPAPASPALISLGGQDQLVCFAAGEIVGVDPNNGNLLWSHPHKTEWGLNISMPVWGPDNIVFISSAYGSGSRGLQLARSGDRTTVSELWANNRMRVHIGTAVRVGDYVYGSSGDFGPAFLTAINVKTGKIAWQDRALARASFVYADGKFIIVDEDGTLALATALPSGLHIQSRVSLLKNKAWTAPTLAGTRLYVRDRRTMIALDLG